MKKRVTAILLGICICSMGTAVVSAAEFTGDAQEDVFSDGISEGSLSAMANNLVERTEEEAQRYMEEKEAAEEKRKEEEARKKAEEERRKAREAKRKAEEAKRKAEEERKAKRQEVVDFALQFEGNPYVYGGTSLTNGADCSGFVMSVFKDRKSVV